MVLFLLLPFFTFVICSHDAIIIALIVIAGVIVGTTIVVINLLPLLLLSTIDHSCSYILCIQLQIEPIAKFISFLHLYVCMYGWMDVFCNVFKLMLCETYMLCDIYQIDGITTLPTCHGYIFGNVYKMISASI